MAFEFKLPDIGEGVVEGEIVSWLVKEGDAVHEDQPLVEVMTDKATVEIPSPREGVIVRRVGSEGEIVRVGATLVVIDEKGDRSTKAASGAVSDAAIAGKAGSPGGAQKSARAQQKDTARSRSHADGSTRQPATPAMRRLAREMGVNLDSVAATGPGGRVTREDIEAAVRAAPGRSAGAVTAQTEERIPLRGLRKRIAERMVRSKRSAPHYTYVEEVDVTSLVELKEKAQEQPDSKEKITYLPFIIKAVVRGLESHPLLNATLDETTQEVVLKKYYNIGVAVATEEGLMVPVVKAADRLSLRDLAANIQRLADDARAGKSRLEDLQGSTFTITSLGALGGILATPIINYPEVAILGVHKIRLRPEYVSGSIEPRHIMYLSLSLDHRVVDGVIGAQFTADVKRLLEAPEQLLDQ
ncbi:MAG TPA: dihydrolipoamide acetyltransferase family protein [Acidobacteriota bacterium]|jgi:pyruvate dehydrogenase E2 component (dihydrolipoamide acetyltransferase)